MVLGWEGWTSTQTSLAEWIGRSIVADEFSIYDFKTNAMHIPPGPGPLLVMKPTTIAIPFGFGFESVDVHWF